MAHRTIRVKYGDQSDDIDVLLAPLMKEIWKAGIETVMSCQGDKNQPAWIEFKADELEKFLDIVCTGDRYENGLRRCANPGVGTWRYSAYAMDAHIPEAMEDLKSIDPEYYDGAVNCFPLFMVVVVVKVPKSDLSEIVRRLKKHKAQRTARRRKTASPAPEKPGVTVTQ